jgi:hypothetical protein
LTSEEGFLASESFDDDATAIEKWLMRWFKSRSLVILGVGFVILAVISRCTDLTDSYRWDKRIVEEMKKQGFEVVGQTSRSDRILSLTFFYPYVGEITLAHPQSIKAFKGFIAADVISFSRDQKGRVESSPRIALFDCQSQLVATLADQQGTYEQRIFRPDGEPVKNWWFGMNEQMISYFCKNPKISTRP